MKLDEGREGETLATVMVLVVASRGVGEGASVLLNGSRTVRELGEELSARAEGWIVSAKARSAKLKLTVLDLIFVFGGGGGFACIPCG